MEQTNNKRKREKPNTTPEGSVLHLGAERDPTSITVGDVYFTQSALSQVRGQFPTCGVRGASNIFAKSRVLSREEATKAGIARPSNRPEDAAAGRNPIYAVDAKLNGCFVLVPAFLNQRAQEDPTIAKKVWPYSAIAFFGLTDDQYRAVSDILDGVEV